MARAIIYQQEPLEDHGQLEPALRAAGFEQVVRLRQVTPNDVNADLVVALGGPMSVYEASRYPFLLDELRVLRKRLELKRPCLGICLGSQLLAAAAGARVFGGAAGLELDVAPVTITEAGRSDSVFQSLSNPFDVAHWHQDTFDQVPASTLLASTDRYAQQAFRVGNSYGLQFHPELTSSMFQAWLDAAPDDSRSSFPTPEIRREALARLDQAQATLGQLLASLATHFAQTVQDSRDFNSSRAITTR